MRERIIFELSRSSSYLAKLLENEIRNREVNEEEEWVSISVEGIPSEIMMNLAKCGYLIKRHVDDTKVSIRTDMEYIYFWLE